MIRLVFDTNIIISALLQPAGPPAQIFLLALGGAIQLCVTGQIYAEYEDVINRPKFRFEQATIARTLEIIRNKGLWVRPTDHIRSR